MEILAAILAASNLWLIYRIRQEREIGQIWEDAFYQQHEKLMDHLKWDKENVILK